MRTARVAAPHRSWAQRLERSPALLWLTAFLPLFGLYLLTMRTVVTSMSPDTISVTSSAWQLAHHGTPRLPAGAAAHPFWLIASGPGHVVSNRPPGVVVLAAVFYALVPSATILDTFPASLAAALVTAAAMGVLALVVRRLGSVRQALAAALLAGTATGTWAVSGTSLWPHGPDQCYLLLALLALAAGSDAWAGAAFAAVTLTRPPLAVVAAVCGLWQSWHRRSVRPALVVGALCALGLGAFLWYSATFWGGGLDSQYTAAGSGFVAPFTSLRPQAWAAFGVNVLGTVLSPGRGVVFGSPFLLLLVPGLRRAWRSAPHWTRSGAVGGLCYMAVQLKANRYGGGMDFWGYRYPLPCLTLAAPLLHLAWREWTARTVRRRAAFAGLAVLSVTVQALGALCYPGVVTGLGGPNPWLDTSHPWVAALVVCVGTLTSATVYLRVRHRGAAAARTTPGTPGDATGAGYGSATSPSPSQDAMLAS